MKLQVLSVIGFAIFHHLLLSTDLECKATVICPIIFLYSLHLMCWSNDKVCSSLPLHQYTCVPGSERRIIHGGDSIEDDLLT